MKFNSYSQKILHPFLIRPEKPIRIWRRSCARKHLVFILWCITKVSMSASKQHVTDEISIGDYLLTGGELGAMVMIDATVRLLPAVLGVNSRTRPIPSRPVCEHLIQRPNDFTEMSLEDLFSGNHQKIADWQEKSFIKLG